MYTVGIAMQTQGRERNVIADALRGVAGLLVPLFHISEPYGWKRGDVASVPQICGHGYLCVEFFLLLMGFMLAHAYDHRWREGMSIGTFFKRRLIRLHPLVVSGAVIGVIVFFAQGLGCPLWDKAMKAFGPWELAGAIAAGLLLLPYPGTGFLVPFNPCAWTLCYEYAANILYGLFVRRLGLVALAVLSVIAGLWSASFALHVDLNAIFGTSCEVVAKAAERTGDSIEIGWSLNPYHAYGACVRLFFPFLFGMFLARTGWKIRIPRGGALHADAVRWQDPKRRIRAHGPDGGVSASAAGERRHAGGEREDGGGVRVLRGTLLPLLHVALSLHEDPQLVGAHAFRQLLGRLLLRGGRVRVPRARRARLAGDEVLGPARAKAARHPALNALQSAANLL